MSTSRTRQELGICLRDARHRTSLTQNHVALHLGITQAAYSQIERGLVRPRPALLLPLAHLLGLGLDHLSALAGYSLDEVVLALHRSGERHAKPIRLCPA